MQRTGLIIKVSLALSGLMGTAYAHNWSAHLLKNSSSASTQTQVMTGGTASLRAAANPPAETPIAEDDLGTSTTPPANSPAEVEIPVISNPAPEKLKDIFGGSSPSIAPLETEESADHAAAGSSFSHPESLMAGTAPDTAASPVSFQNNEETATVGMQPNASPVPETSTSVGFGGMLALGIGLMAVRRWKLSSRQ